MKTNYFLISSLVIYLLTTTTELFSFWQEKGIDFDYTRGNTLCSVIGILIFIYSLYVIIKKRYETKKILFEHWLILSVFFLFFISCFWSDFANIAFKRFLKIFIMYTILLAAYVSGQWKKTIEKSIFYYSIIVIVISVLLIAFFPTYGLMVYDDGNLLPKGIFTHKNSLGIFSAISSIWFFYRWLKFPKKIPLIFGTCFLLLIASRSTTSIFSFFIAVSIIVFAVFLKRVKIKLRASIFFITCSCIMFSLLSLSLLGKSFSNIFIELTGKDFTFTGRTDIWPALIQIGLSRPLLGSGYGVFFMGYETPWITNFLKWRATTAHNGFIQIFLENGLLGLFLISVIIVSLTIKIFKSKNIFYFGIFFSLICFNIFEAGLFRPVYSFFMFLVVYIQFNIKEKITNICT